MLIVSRLDSQFLGVFTSRPPLSPKSTTNSRSGRRLHLGEHARVVGVLNCGAARTPISACFRTYSSQHPVNG